MKVWLLLITVHLFFVALVRMTWITSLKKTKQLSFDCMHMLLFLLWIMRRSINFKAQAVFPTWGLKTGLGPGDRPGFHPLTARPCGYLDSLTPPNDAQKHTDVERSHRTYTHTPTIGPWFNGLKSGGGGVCAEMDKCQSGLCSSIWGCWILGDFGGCPRLSRSLSLSLWTNFGSFPCQKEFRKQEAQFFDSPNLLRWWSKL